MLQGRTMHDEGWKMPRAVSNEKRGTMPMKKEEAKPAEHK